MGLIKVMSLRIFPDSLVEAKSVTTTRQNKKPRLLKFDAGEEKIYMFSTGVEELLAHIKAGEQVRIYFFSCSQTADKKVPTITIKRKGDQIYVLKYRPQSNNEDTIWTPLREGNGYFRQSKSGDFFYVKFPWTPQRNRISSPTS